MKTLPKALPLWRVERSKQNNMMFWSFVFLLIRLACHYLIGLLTGYRFVLQEQGVFPVLQDFFAAAVGCLLFELLRWILVSFLVLTPLGRWGAGISAALVLAVLQILYLPEARSTALLSLSGIIGILLPALARSALATALLTGGGFCPALLYVLATRALPALIPLEPTTSSAIAAIMDLALHMIFLIILDCDASPEDTEKASSPFTWVPFAALLLLLVAFFMGFLPWQPVVVATGSMEPDISVGDMTIYSKLDRSDLETGDIIAFQRDGRTIIHRIAELDQRDGQTVYITRGDANNANDEGYVTPEDVFGRVIFTIPKLGQLALWLHTS